MFGLCVSVAISDGTGVTDGVKVGCGDGVNVGCNVTVNIGTSEEIGLSTAGLSTAFSVLHADNRKTTREIEEMSRLMVLIVGEIMYTIKTQFQTRLFHTKLQKIYICHCETWKRSRPQSVRAHLGIASSLPLVSSRNDAY